MHCAVQSTHVDLGAKACQGRFLNLSGNLTKIRSQYVQIFGICSNFSHCFYVGKTFSSSSSQLGRSYLSSKCSLCEINSVKSGDICTKGRPVSKRYT